MMVVIDTNHFRELLEDGPLGQSLLARVDEERAEVFTCIVVAEESIRGWFALLNREQPGHDQLDPYFELKRSIDTLTHFDILGIDREAADIFVRLRRQLPRLGMMDLKLAQFARRTIACCCLATSRTSIKSKACVWRTGWIELQRAALPSSSSE